MAALDEMSVTPGRESETALQTSGDVMAITFTTLPFEVVAGTGGGIVIEDRKTRHSWWLSNSQTLEFVRLIGRRRRLAEHLASHRKYREPAPEPGE